MTKLWVLLQALLQFTTQLVLGKVCGCGGLHDWVKVCYSQSMRCDWECQRCGWQKGARQFRSEYVKCSHCQALCSAENGKLWHVPKCPLSK